MLDFLEALLTNWDYFLLLFIRVFGLVLTSPIFGRSSIPNSAKVVYAVCLTGFFYVAATQVREVNYDDNLLLYILLCVKEFLFGVVMSYVLNVFILMVTFTAGQMVDMQLGFAMVNVFDPQTNASIPVTANLFNITMLLVFFAVNGHLRLIEMMYLSIETIPVGSVVVDPNIAWVAVELFVKAFLLAVTIFLPIYGAAMLEEISFGVLMRMVPQLNAFAISMPIKSILGFAILFAIMPTYVHFCNDIFGDMFAGMEQMFAMLRG